jgi:integrase
VAKSPESLGFRGDTIATDLETAAAIAERVRGDLETAAALAEQDRAPNSRRAYSSDVAAWTSYAEAAGVVFPAEAPLFAAWLAAMAKSGLARATILRRASAVASWHRDAGEESPTEDRHVRRVLRGVARTGDPSRGKRALTPEMLTAAWPSLSVRDRALVATGFAGALRRSELVALTWPDVEETAAGFTITVRRSKTDQLGAGRCFALLATGAERDAPEALRAWALEQGSPDTGRVFPFSARTVARVCKRVAELAGGNPADFSGHSLRSGFATAAAEAGASLPEIMAVTGHRSASVAARYVRPAEAARNRASRLVAERLG